MTFHLKLTRANLTNHIRSNHGQRAEKFACKFWLNGYCFYSDEECRFSHNEPVESNKICFFGFNCTKPNCAFYHPKPCNFQQNCRNANCTFWHFGNESFLDMSSMREFPPLNSKKFNPRMMWYEIL